MSLPHAILFPRVPEEASHAVSRDVKSEETEFVGFKNDAVNVRGKYDII